MGGASAWVGNVTGFTSRMISHVTRSQTPKPGVRPLPGRRAAKKISKAEAEARKAADDAHEARARALAGNTDTVAGSTVSNFISQLLFGSQTGREIKMDLRRLKEVVTSEIFF